MTYQIINSLYVRNNEQLIDVPDEYGETMSISIAELMVGTNRLSPYNYNGAADPHLEPYTFYSVACNNAYTYYVYDHLGNTRITYTPTVTNNALSYHLNGVFDYYPYAKILREYIDGQQEKYLSTHHERDVETGLDYRGARFYDCDIARFLSLDPLAVVFHEWTAFNYVTNNPLKYTDPSGKIRFDVNGSIIIKETDKNPAQHRTGNAYWLEKPVVIYTDKGTEIEAHKNLTENQPHANADCHGITFARGQIWINNDQVQIILDDEYTKVDNNDVKIGMVAIYKVDGEIQHSMTVVEVDENTGDVKVKGKGGTQTSQYITNSKDAWTAEPGKTVVIEYYEKTSSLSIQLDMSESTPADNTKPHN